MSEKLTLKFLEKYKILLVLFIRYDDYIHIYELCVVSILYFASILKILFCILYFKYSQKSIWYFGILNTEAPVFCILYFKYSTLSILPTSVNTSVQLTGVQAMADYELHVLQRIRSCYVTPCQSGRCVTDTPIST